MTATLPLTVSMRFFNFVQNYGKYNVDTSMIVSKKSRDRANAQPLQ